MPDTPLWQLAYNRWVNDGDAIADLDASDRDRVRAIVMACLAGLNPLSLMRANGWYDSDAEPILTRGQARRTSAELRAAANEVELIRGK